MGRFAMLLVAAAAVAGLAAGEGAAPGAATDTPAATETPTTAAAYPLYKHNRFVRRYHTRDFPKFAVENLTQDILAKSSHDHGYHHDHDRGTDGHGGAGEGLTDDEQTLVDYLAAVFWSRPTIAVGIAALLLCVGCLGNVFTVYTAFTARRSPAGGGGGGGSVGSTRGARRWPLRVAVSLLVVLGVGSALLFASVHVAEDRQYASFAEMQVSVDAVAGWAGEVQGRIDMLQGKLAAAQSLAHGGLDACANASGSNASAAIEQLQRELQRQLGGIAAALGPGGDSFPVSPAPAADAVGTVVRRAANASGIAKQGVDHALAAMDDGHRRHFWLGSGFLFFFVAWGGLLLSCGRAFAHDTSALKQSVAVNVGTSTCTLVTMWGAYVAGAGVLFLVMVVGDFCYDARGNLLMLTTNNDPQSPSYAAMDYYINCGGYSEARLEEAHPFTGTAQSVAASLRTCTELLDAIQNEAGGIGAEGAPDASVLSSGTATCSAAVAGLRSLLGETTALSVGPPPGGLLAHARTAASTGGAASTGNGILECAELNSKLEDMLSTFCADVYGPFVFFWIFFMCVGLLLCLSDGAQRCLWATRPPPQHVTIDHPGIYPGGVAWEGYHPMGTDTKVIDPAPAWSAPCAKAADGIAVLLIDEAGSDRAVPPRYSMADDYGPGSHGQALYPHLQASSQC